jgi:cytoskeletal protein RodZ
MVGLFNSCALDAWWHGSARVWQQRKAQEKSSPPAVQENQEEKGSSNELEKIMNSARDKLDRQVLHLP